MTSIDRAEQFTLLLGTKNECKIKEIKSLLADIPCLNLLTYRERPFSDVTESGKTFCANALIKVRQIAHETGLAVLADDSGLEVFALDGKPGVDSAHFAGFPKDDRRNNLSLLRALAGEKDRSASFLCVTVLHLADGQEYITEGALDGEIAFYPRGENGFGYDSIFIPRSYNRTAAELTSDEKNAISHRYKALRAMKDHLRNIITPTKFNH
ncbi:RdgB/HAM1 family non-canonical purine NTP pyrophosphatase [Candidatus Acetothermia bacterium]|jgi:XTP/dITP diphosphohydrolase|nr:RdgB/HAM1 family non-canonical purine NTP pyrophosphatase [Candidatus Acetothermia bacterium]MCI2427015.1 RdgB/HAM1 family non-canonical purine NTP pyrophosphatase [Candidatus Acetothermia bacterium]MCI2428941.1 RdgB/HAM1 family non-canonical purine NTP pyrophosphatase [Candidatus Acetothermia bacterium]